MEPIAPKGALQSLFRQATSSVTDVLRRNAWLLLDTGCNASVSYHSDWTLHKAKLQAPFPAGLLGIGLCNGEGSHR